MADHGFKPTKNGRRSKHPSITVRPLHRRHFTFLLLPWLGHMDLHQHFSLSLVNLFSYLIPTAAKWGSGLENCRSSFSQLGWIETGHKICFLSYSWWLHLVYLSHSLYQGNDKLTRIYPSEFKFKRGHQSILLLTLLKCPNPCLFTIRRVTRNF